MNTKELIKRLQDMDPEGQKTIYTRVDNNTTEPYLSQSTIRYTNKEDEDYSGNRNLDGLVIGF